MGRMLETMLIPATEAGSGRLMIVLHGLGDSMAGYEWMPAALGLPWLNYLLVNAPDSYYGGYSWYDFEGDAAAGIERSRALLFELIETQRQAGWATDRTLLFGFSQGCLMALETGIRYTRRLAGLVGISGYVFDLEGLLAAPSPVAKEQRFLITHGLQDPLLPFSQVKAQVQRLQAAGIGIEWHEFAKEHTIAGDEELSVIRRFITARFEAR
jgi:phospholipase/carboxylesterase